MLKKVLLSVMFALLFSKTTITAQKYDYLIKVKIIRTDEVIYNPDRSFETIQVHTLQLEKQTKFQYKRSDKVGFEIDIENRSLSQKKYKYGFSYTPQSETQINGIPVPIVIPPEEDDENINNFGSVSNFPHIPDGKILYLERDLDLTRKIKIWLTLLDEKNEIIGTPVHKIETPYFLFFSNATTKNTSRVSFNQNYSNTKIKYNSSTSNTANIRIYDFSGRLIQALNAEPIANKNSTSYNFPTPHLKKGLYFYKIDIDGFTETRKVYKKE
ncbi:T9SS type A sorting domain-containing protein [Tenacibaculum sp. 190524A05c]|uniref:T9SS type A sorting domain-containing protein n=1 Tax=Tenacibaculum platacis TaxID=3137852 RepID=UPI0031FB71ED